MDPRYTRVRNMLTRPEVPRFSGGGIALCHWCQRSAYWSKDFLTLLIRDIQCFARYGGSHSSAGGNATYHTRQKLWDAIIKAVADGKKVDVIAEDVGCAPTTVYEVMKKYNLPTATQIRKGERRMKKLESFGVDRAKLVQSMRQGGQSWNSIAAKMGEKREHVMSAHICLTGTL